MRALVVPADGTGVPVVADVPEPRPLPGQAVVEVRAAAVNRGELSLLGQLPPGASLGWDVAGTVVAAAADGTGPAAGTRVLGLAERDGWAERVALSASRLAAIPAAVSWEEAAALPVAGLTALYVLDTAGPLLGRRVLVTGAGGGVGRLLVQLACAAGAEVTAWVGAPERGAGLKELGAAAVSGYGEGTGAGVDVVVDSVGGDVLRAAFSLLGPGGTLVAYGNTTRTELCLPVDWGHSRPGITVRYVHLFHETGRRPVAADLARLVAMAGSGRLDPQVASARPFTEVASVLDGLARRTVNGKAVLLF